MNRNEVIAQSLSCWIEKRLNNVSYISREGLPQMDIPYFFRSLGKINNFPTKDFSIALAGFGYDTTTLRLLANEEGLNSLRDIADNLNAAAAWRNSPKKYPRILALASGKHPGVHTLKHFANPNSRELASAVLEWAASTDEFEKTGAQQYLLEILARSQQLENLRSLEMVADFLAYWSEIAKEDINDAPRRALQKLGLLIDPDLFKDRNSIEQRLIKNLDIKTQIMDASPSMLRTRRSQIERYNNESIRDELLDILDRVSKLRLNSSNSEQTILTLEEAQKALRPTSDKAQDQEPDDKNPPETDNNEEDEDQEELNVKGLAKESASNLLDDQQDNLEAIAKALEDAWQEASANDLEKIEGEVQTKDETHSFSFDIDKGFLGWLNTFCTENVWGGLIESKEPSLELALKNHENARKAPIKLSPDPIIIEDGEAYSISGLLESFDKAVKESNGMELNLAPMWERFCEIRTILISNINYLVYFPLAWLGGKPLLAKQVDEYLDLSSKIYETFQLNYSIMSSLSESLARTVLEGLLALDVLQVRIELDDSRVSHKAILLPTHPLHLWRFQRLSTLLRGLGVQISTSDREAILKEVMRPEQFLSVLWLGSIPDGHGADQILPIANQINNLATFENLRNAISGVDGSKELANAIDKFAILNRYHTRPLRLAIVNPPEASKLMADLISVLNHRRESTLPCLRVELFCTPDHSHRLQMAMRLTEERDLLEDKVASGRLEFKVHELPYRMDDLIEKLETYPFHILAIFDEASIYIRRRNLGKNLPMSPFCVRQSIRSDSIRHEVELEPSSDEPPFSEYMELVNEAQRGQRDSSPHAWADAESLRKVIDKVLINNPPIAHWVFLADRALPSEGKMQSVRLLQRREGQRQILLAAADYRKLSELILPIFNHHNLSISNEQLESLLQEGIGIIGSGFLELIRAKDGRADSNQARGLSGMLLAARDYKQRYPECLLVSVDSELPRLWLRLGQRSKDDRCDLLAVRKESDCFIVECIEVKTTESDVLTDDSVAIKHAKEQIINTLEACKAAFPDNYSGKDPLSAPRCEMLKEIFVRACQSRSLSSEIRKSWCSYLPELFGQNEQSINIKYSGEIIRVLLGINEKVSEGEICSDPFNIKIRTLTEGWIQDLIEVKVANVREEKKVDPGKEKPKDRTTITPDNSAKQSEQETIPVAVKSVKTKKPESSELNKSEIVAGSSKAKPSEGITSDKKQEEITVTVTNTLEWPPPVNALGMIGQVEAVAQLVSQVNFTRAANKRFPDKLLVGSAGVGKSSLARAIARKLLHQEEILFNGADLSRAIQLISKLQEKQKVPKRLRGNIHVEQCLIFIDEVHAINSNVEIALLNAMDDQRVTTIDGVNYDFGDVIFILATTDPGKLSEAFNTRPDKTYLKPYTLYELAGIVWLHGKGNLDGYELSQDVCYEISARMRCQPRRAVRALTQTLIPHFYSLTHKPEEKIEYSRIGAALIKDAVGLWFEQQGIDLNGIDNLARNFLSYLRRNGATSAERLQQALGITNRADFLEVDEYLVRLGLTTISAAGRTLTREGSRYLQIPFDLRDRISRQSL